MAADIPPNKLDALLRFGLLGMAYTGDIDLTMLQASSFLLNSSNRPTLLALSQAVATAQGVPVNVTQTAGTLTLLQKIIPALPHQSPSWYRLRAMVHHIWMTALMLIFIAVRFYGRVIIAKRMLLEDWIMIPAVILTIGVALNCRFSDYLGYANRHIYDISIRHIMETIPYFFAGEVLYTIAIAVVKTSIIAFFYKLSPKKAFRRSVLTLFTLNLLVTIVGTFVIVFQCKPLGFWNHPFTAKCINRAVAFKSLSAVLIVTDLLLFVTPIPSILRLQLKLREKCIVIGVLGLGLLVCIASVERLLTIDKFIDDVDVTNKGWPTGVWSVAELDFAIIVSCVPALRVVILHHAPRLIGYQRSNPSKDQQQPQPGQTPENPLANRDGSKETPLKGWWSIRLGSRSMRADPSRQGSSFGTVMTGVSEKSVTEDGKDIDPEIGIRVRHEVVKEEYEVTPK